MVGRAGWSIAVGLALSAVVVGCEDGGHGSLVIVNGGGGSTASTNTGSSNNSNTGGNTIPAGSYTVVKADPGGGTVLQSADGTTRKIAGSFSESLTMEAQYTWVLDAPVFFGDDTATATPTLTIQAGTKVLCRGGTPPSMLVIRRAAKLVAVGTAAAPIVFTSAQPVGSRAPGDWGGIVINGRAPTNEIGPAGELPFGEGGSGKYGGTDPNDDSGELRYLRVEFAGHVFTSDDELNGIAFQGVGAGTEVDFIQVHRNADDGVEFFGGTVNVKHLLVTGALDDSLDWTSGWTGKVQFAVLQQWAGGADNGIEADNLAANNDATPRSRPVISNLTCIGPAVATEASDLGMHLKVGTGGNVLNSIFMEMNEFALDIDNPATFNNAYTDDPTSYTTLSGELTIRNCIFFANSLGDFQNDAGEPVTDATFSGQQSPPNQAVDPLLAAPTNESAPDFRPGAGSPALNSAAWVDPADAFFQVVTYVGAMDGTTDWTAGWTTHAPN